MHRVLPWLLAFSLYSQVPSQDSRNVNIPGTNTHAVLPSFSNVKDWEARKAKLRRQILAASGLLPLPDRSPLHPLIFGKVEHPDYTIEKVLLETMPGYYLGGNLYRPRAAGRHPGVLNAHGHWTYGRLENQDAFSGPSLGISLARQGYVAFAYDMVGYNDTLQTPHSFGNQVEQLWAWGPLGLQLWNSIRALDFLESLEDVDPKRLGMTGASGGGTQTFLLTAVDDRLQFAAPVNMVSAIMQGGDDCENQPNLRIGTNNVEIAAMFAPKPMLLVSATGDWTRNVPKEEFPAIQKIYGLYGKPENVEVVQIDAPHNYNKSSREAVYRFFGKQVLGNTDANALKERRISIEMLQDMLALANRTLPANALTYEKLFDSWKRVARRQTDETSDTGLLRERLQLALAAEWPRQVIHDGNGEHVVLGRQGVGDRIPGFWKAGKGVPALVVHPEGAEAARNSPIGRKMLSEGRPVLFIDAFQTGTAVAPRNRSESHFLTFNKTDDANRVQDVLTALAFLKSQTNTTPELIGIGNAAVWAMYTAAVAPAPVKLSADLGDFRGTDQDYVSRFFVPGIQRAGGLDAARRTVSSHR